MADQREGLGRMPRAIHMSLMIMTLLTLYIQAVSFKQTQDGYRVRVRRMTTPRLRHRLVLERDFQRDQCKAWSM